MLTSLITIVILISTIFFYPSFSLGFGGDDYYGLLDYLRTLEGNSIININFFLWQYGAQDTLFGFIYRVFGLNSTPFFIISFLLRIVATASFYPLFRLFTSKRYAVFFPMLFFAVTFAGIESTSWSFNMMVYVAISLLNLFFFCRINYHKTLNIKYHFFSVVLFTLAIILSPTRMTGLFPFALLTETYWLAKRFNLNSLKLFFVSIISFLAAIIFILSIGTTLANGSNLRERINFLKTETTADTSKSVFDHLRDSNFKILLNPIIDVGAVIIPIENSNQYEIIFSAPRRFILIWFLIFTFLLFLINRESKNFSKNLFLSFILLAGAFSLFTYFLVMRSRDFFPTSGSLIWFLSGGLFLILTGSLIVKSFIKENALDLGVIGLFWMIASITLFWYRFPETAHPSFHRYLITPAVGLTILFAAFFINLKRSKDLLIFIVFILTLSHAQVTHNFLLKLTTHRSKAITQSVRGNLPKIKDLQISASKDHPLVFFFESRDKEKLYHNILFGFPVMVAINEKLMYFPNLVYTDNWAEVVDDYQTGKSLKRFSWKETPVPIQNIFAYKLEENILIDETEVIRDRLKQL